MLARLTAEDIGALAGLMESDAVRPVIDRRFSLQEVSAALEYSETGRARGKIVINVE